MKMTRNIGLILFLFVPLISGCKVGPDYCRPSAPFFDSYAQIDSERGVQQQVGADLIEWWSSIDDPVLNALLAQSVANSPSLRESMWRIQQARAQLGVTRSELFPQIAADGSYNLRKLSGISNSTETWALGTSMSWELDVFGRLQRYTDASMADLETQRELYRDTYIILLADVAMNYVTARAYQQQIDIARTNIELRRQTLAMTEGKLDVPGVGGIGTSHMLDVHQARGSLESVEAELPDLEAGLRITLNRLSVLLGMPPGSYVDELLSEPGNIPAAPQEILVGIPADLIRRRPDLRAAEQKIVAQTARIGGAVGDLYPIFSLNGTFGLDASTFSGLWSHDNIYASVGPGVRWNILNFGRYRSNVRLQEFKQQELIVAYQRNVLEAAEEVDNALASYVNEKDRMEKLNQSVYSYTEALKYSQERYRTGITDLQRVLDSQREKLSAETQYTVSRANAISDVITLYRALGGGWQYGVPEN